MAGPGLPPPAPPPTTVIPGSGWVDVASRVVIQLGFPVVVAGVLLYFLLGTFQSSMAKIAEHMATNSSHLERLLDQQERQIEELQKQTESLKIIAQEAQRPR